MEHITTNKSNKATTDDVTSKRQITISLHLTVVSQTARKIGFESAVIQEHIRSLIHLFTTIHETSGQT
jgi:hypothetical protein